MVNGLTGKERANIVNQSLHKLYEVGVKVVSLTCDGPSYHLSMFEELGADITPLRLKQHFHILLILPTKYVQC